MSNLLEERDMILDRITNARRMGMCNQDILKMLLEAATASHILDRQNRAKINGLDVSYQEEGGPLTQDFINRLLKQIVQSSLQIQRLETERRAYITEIESLGAKCSRLEEELKTSLSLIERYKTTVQSLS